MVTHHGQPFPLGHADWHHFQLPLHIQAHTLQVTHYVHVGHIVVSQPGSTTNAEPAPLLNSSLLTFSCKHCQHTTPDLPSQKCIRNYTPCLCIRNYTPCLHPCTPSHLLPSAPLPPLKPLYCHLQHGSRPVAELI